MCGAQERTGAHLWGVAIRAPPPHMRRSCLKGWKLWRRFWATDFVCPRAESICNPKLQGIGLFQREAWLQNRQQMAHAMIISAAVAMLSGNIEHNIMVV